MTRTVAGSLPAVAALASLLAALVVAPAPAQAQVTADSNTAYANFGDDYYLAMDQVGSGASGQVGVADQQPQEQTMDLDPALSAPAALGNGTIDVLACFDTNAAVAGTVPVLLGGRISVSTEVRLGSTVIATGAAQDVVLVPSTVGKATWNLTPTVTTLDPSAGNLEWFLHEGGAASGALFIPDCGDGSWSHVTFPVVGATGGNVSAPVIAWSNVTGDIASVNRTFASPSNGTSVYNWTTDASAVRVRYAANVTSGSLAVTVRDGSGAAVYDVTLNATAQGQKDLLEAVPGNWSVTLNATAFQGSIAVTLQPGAEAGPEPSNSTTGSTTPNDDNRTGTFPLRKTDKAPGLGVPLLLAATAAAAVLARRRTA